MPGISEGESSYGDYRSDRDVSDRIAPREGGMCDRQRRENCALGIHTGLIGPFTLEADVILRRNMNSNESQRDERPILIPRLTCAPGTPHTRQRDGVKAWRRSES